MSVLSINNQFLDQYKLQLSKAVEKTSLATDQQADTTLGFVLELDEQTIAAATKDAAQKAGDFAIIFFDPLNLGYEGRSEKLPARVMAKIQDEQGNHDAEKAWTNFVRPVCDFMAFRIYCAPNDILQVIDTIREVVLERGDVLAVRGANKDKPNGLHWDHKNNKLKDIVQYVYVYSKEIGHIAEVQVGHSFAALAFTQNSEKRDITTAESKYNGIDIWKKFTLPDGTELKPYNMIKQYILNQCNGDPQEYTKEEIRDMIEAHVIKGNDDDKYTQALREELGRL